MEEYKREMEDYFCRFTFGQFVTLILLEVVTLFFVFYLGAHYGTDLLGSKNKTAGSALPKNAPQSVDDIVGGSGVDYTYPDVLTSPDGKQAIRVKPSGVTAEEYEKQKRGLVPNVNVTNLPPPQVQAQAPVETPINLPEEETPPAPPPATEEKPLGKFAIQVGSYQSSQEAESMVKTWLSKGYASFMAVGDIPGKGTWYRVRIGGFETREEAEKFLENFKQKEKTPALVVVSRS